MEEGQTTIAKEKKKQRENNELQNTVKKTKYRVTRTPTENRD